MSVREWLNQNPAVTTIITIMVLGTALVALALALRDRAVYPVVGRYYYDLNTGVLKADHVVGLAGMTSRSEEQGVVAAYVFSCGLCGDYTGMTAEQVEQAGGFIGYLESWSVQARAVLRRGASSREDELTVKNGRMIRQINDEQWHPADEYEHVLRQALNRRCASEASPTRCQPGN